MPFHSKPYWHPSILMVLSVRACFFANLSNFLNAEDCHPEVAVNGHSQARSSPSLKVGSKPSTTSPARRRSCPRRFKNLAHCSSSLGVKFCKADSLVHGRLTHFNLAGFFSRWSFNFWVPCFESKLKPLSWFTLKHWYPAASNVLVIVEVPEHAISTRSYFVSMDAIKSLTGVISAAVNTAALATFLAIVGRISFRHS